MKRWIIVALFPAACGGGQREVPVSLSVEPPRASATEPPRTCEAEARSHAPPTAAERVLSEWLARPESGRYPDLESQLEVACGEPSKAGPALRAGGDAAACTVLGVLLSNGDGVQQDSARAQRMFRRAAVGRGFDLGGRELASSSVTLGILSGGSYGDRGAMACPKNCERACRGALAVLRSRWVEPLQRSCDAGRATACFLIGVQYAYGASVQGYGVLVDNDAARARAAFRRACDAGLGAACGHLATHIARDPAHATRADRARALELERRGCALGDGTSCAEVGLAAATIADGRAFFERACELGMVAVCRDLGELLSTGQELPRDPVAAEKYRKLGATP